MIKKLIAAVALCAAGMASSAELGYDRHVNETLGITRPAGWHWTTAQQNPSAPRLGSEEFQKQVVQHTTAPLVVMTQHEKPYDGLNASFKANIRAFDSLPTGDPRKLLSMILPTVQQQMTDAQFVVPV